MKTVTKSVVVLPYDEQWEQTFARIKDEILKALGTLALRIEHVGSTSVRGLSAKPIIDIDVVIKDYSVFDAVAAALEEIGYHHEGDLGIAMREAFRYDGKEHLQKHHLYVCPQDSAELKRHLAFRDYLRSDPEGCVNTVGSRKKAQRSIRTILRNISSTNLPLLKRYIERLAYEILFIEKSSVKSPRQSPVLPRRDRAAARQVPRRGG